MSEKRLNEDLIDPKEYEIGLLKARIEEFKKYDNKRKLYYKDALFRLGQLESLVDEVDIEDKLKKKLKDQSKTIAQLQLVIKAKNIKIPEDLNLTKAAVHISELQKQLNEKSKKIREQQKTISDLIYKLYNNETN